MADNYKHLYEQMKKMVEMYQDELVPGLRKKIEELEQSRVEVVLCEGCKHEDDCLRFIKFYGRNTALELNTEEFHPLKFCSYGERSEGE